MNPSTTSATSTTLPADENSLVTYPVRVSIETNAKGQLQPKFSFAYRDNLEMIANLRMNYALAFLQIQRAAHDCGQEIAGSPVIPTPESEA